MSRFTVNQAGPIKRCSKCRQEKDRGAFSKRARSKDGLQSWCRACLREYVQTWEDTPVGRLSRKQINYRHRQSNPLFKEQDAARARARRHTPEGKRKQKAVHLRRHYGLALEQFEEMKQAQGGRCAICRTEARLAVDHDHVTGAVRALLCDLCNRGIGMLRESREVLLSAIEYLERHGAVRAA